MAVDTQITPTNIGRLEYQPPHDLEAEICLLGSLLLDNEMVAEVHEVIDKEYFYDSRHQLIYEAILQLYDNRSPIDLVTLKNQLEKSGPGILDKIGGIDYLTTLVESVPVAGNALYYARIIREKHIVRQIQLGCYEILRQTSEMGKTPEELLDRAEQIIFEVARKSETAESIKIADILKDAYEQIAAARDRKSRLIGLPTGLTELDDLLGGLQGGQFIVVAGRPGSGKSSFGLRLMEEVGLNERKPLVLYTLEVTRQQVVKNLLCAYARVNSKNLRTGEFISHEDIQRLLTSAGKFQETQIFIDDTVQLTPFDLRTRVRRLKMDYDIQLVIVDYLQLMMMKEADNREREIAQISYALKSLAKELNIPVVAMAQLSRAPEQRDEKHPVPRLSDLRESGAIEQDADVVLLLYRDELHNPTTEENKNICEINVAKQRNGPTGRIEVAFLKEYTRFEDLYRERAEY